MAATGSWIKPVPQGIYVEPGDFWIDPQHPVDRALVTHGHADHARPGHRAVLATQPTLDIMDVRYGPQMGAQAIAYDAPLKVGDVGVSFIPAGHVLGSAQIVMEHKGERIIVSGDYKRRADPTCQPFRATPCDIFITEATFGLPVFRHPEIAGEVGRLLETLAHNPDRCITVGAYALGKAQRLIMELRAAGHAAPIYLHGAMQRLCTLYQNHGCDLGELLPVTPENKRDLKGRIVLCPPSALNDRWSRGLPDPVSAMASGWMRIRQRARQRNVELPLVISDHADWDELTATITEIDPEQVWITHGREDALLRWCTLGQRKGRALELVGLDDEDAE